MSELILKTPELQGMDKSKADQIRATFEPMVEMLDSFDNAYNEVLAEDDITEAVTLKARRVRLAISKVRTETERIRKSQKEQYLRAGKAIDGVANILKWAVADKEDRLMGIEKFFERKEQERLELLQEDRVGELAEYVNDASERDLSSMEEDVWEAYLAAKKQAHADRIAAEKKAEEEKIAREKAEEKERLRIRKENERLKEEAEAREKADKARREKEEIKLAKEREKLRKEKAEREALEAKLREKEEAELKRIAEEKAVIQRDLQKGDVDKMNDLVNDLRGVTEKYSFKSAKYKKLYDNVNNLVGKIIKYIDQ